MRILNERQVVLKFFQVKDLHVIQVEATLHLVCNFYKDFLNNLFSLIGRYLHFVGILMPQVVP